MAKSTRTRIVVKPEEARRIREESKKSPVQKIMFRINQRANKECAPLYKKRQKLVKQIQQIDHQIKMRKEKIFQEEWLKELKK